MPAPPSVTDVVLSNQLDSGAVTSTGTIVGVNPTSGLVSSVTATSPLASSGGATPDISIVPAGIPNADLAVMPSDTIKGNNTGIAARPIDLTVAQVLTLLGLPAGAIPFTPSAPGDWSPQPTTIQQAIDQLASRPRSFLVMDTVVTNIASLAAFPVANTESGTPSVAGDRLLVAAQTTGTENGIYVVGVVTGATAPLTRAPDMPVGYIVKGSTKVTAERSSGFNLALEWASLAQDLVLADAVIGTDDPQFYPRYCQLEARLRAGTLTWGGGADGGVLFSTGASNATVITRQDPFGNTTLTAAYSAPLAGRVPGVNGVARIVIQADVAAGTINVADTSSFNIYMFNW